jgi:histidine triad (HIT) family protein
MSVSFVNTPHLLVMAACAAMTRRGNFDAMDNCIFCKIIARKIPGYIVDEDESIIVFMSLENHPMIVPKAHIPDIFSLSVETASQIMTRAIHISAATKAATAADGIYITQTNGKAAGQDVFHYHMHIYPKWLDGRKPETSAEARQAMMAMIRDEMMQGRGS